MLVTARDWQVWGHEACVADLATASVDVLLVLLLTALAVGLCRPRATAASVRTQPRQPTLSERALLLELTATLLLLVAWIRLVYAANDHGWRQLTPERYAFALCAPAASRLPNARNDHHTRTWCSECNRSTLTLLRACHGW